jgi:amino-acid N-acetyltransferase
MEPYEITAAAAADWPDIERLLADGGLPVEGLSTHRDTTLVAREPRRIVGCAALELYGDAALLRSVAVDGGLRRSGVGTALTVAALELARRHRVRQVYLLTETAAEFFPRFGFTRIGRSDVPETVRRSVEFMQLCPDSAVVMTLALRAEGAGDATR